MNGKYQGLANPYCPGLTLSTYQVNKEYKAISNINIR